jgi:AcrR family transcriptional regulator
MPQSNRRSAPRRGRIDREYIVAAALAIVDRTGLDNLSIRSLAASIDRDPMTVYHYLPTKQALLDAIVDSVLTSLDAVDPTNPDWQSELSAFARHYRDLALAHPHAATLIATRPLSRPLGSGTHTSLRHIENVLALMTAAGFTVSEALSSYRMLLSFIRGHILSEMQERTERPDETADLLRLAVRRLPVADFSLLSARPPIIDEYDGAHELEHSVNVLIRGLGHVVERAGHAQP